MAEKNDDSVLRDHLISLLKGGNAHATFDDAVKDFPVSEINTTAQNVPYSAWQLLEHIRRTQWDILDFVRNPNYKELKWPDDYWPPKTNEATAEDWQNSINKFNSDLKEMQEITKDGKTDLYSKIPHGEGQTVLREILLVADHNAYHIGEMVLMRRTLGIWKK